MGRPMGPLSVSSQFAVRLLLRAPEKSILLHCYRLIRIEEGRGVYRVLVGKSEGKRPLGRPRHRWEDNIKMNIQEVGTGWSWLRLGAGGGDL